VDGEEAGKVGGDTLKFRVKDLNADSTYTFRIMAGDAANQWIASADLIYQMPPHVSPPGRRILYFPHMIITETSMI